LEKIQEHIKLLCSQLRNECVALADAFNLQDFMLLSCLGVKDGDIYRKYIQRVNQAPTQNDIPAPYWKSLIKPILNKS